MLKVNVKSIMLKAHTMFMASKAMYVMMMFHLYSTELPKMYMQ